MQLETPTQLGADFVAVLGIIGTIAGTVVGAVLAYFFSYRLEKVKAHELAQRIEALLFLEIGGHQIRLDSTLDGLLPQWFRRGERPLHHIIPYAPPLQGVAFPKLTTTYFDKFFEHLVHSKHLLHFADYYRGVHRLNSQVDYLNGKPGDAESTKEDCVRDCAALLAGSLQIMDSLVGSPGLAERLGPQHSSEIDSFAHSRRRYELIAELTKYDLPQLLGWQSKPTSELPSPFNDDAGKLWESYLKAALPSEPMGRS